MADKKVIFIAFAIEDRAMRDLLAGQSKLGDCPIEFVDMSVKEPYDSEWKARVRTRIRRSDGVIALVSRDTDSSSGQKWEIGCAQDEKKKILGVWPYQSDRSKPSVMDGERIIPWTWEGIADFIKRL